MRRAVWMSIAQVIALGLIVSFWLVQGPELKGEDVGKSGVDHPSAATLTGEGLFAKVVEHNLKREANLKPIFPF